MFFLLLDIFSNRLFVSSNCMQILDSLKRTVKRRFAHTRGVAFFFGSTGTLQICRKLQFLKGLAEVVFQVKELLLVHPANAGVHIDVE